MHIYPLNIIKMHSVIIEKGTSSGSILCSDRKFFNYKFNSSIKMMKIFLKDIHKYYIQGPQDKLTQFIYYFKK